MEKLGDTIFFLRNFSAEIDSDAYLPVSALNSLRRQAVEGLFALRMGTPREYAALTLPKIERAKKTAAALSVQSADPDILHRALQSGADSAIFAPEDLREAALNEALQALPERFSLALPAVMSEKTLDLLHRWAAQNASRISRTLLSNVGQLGLSWPGEAAADCALNIANELSIAQLRDWGIEKYVPSVELNRSQIEDLGGRRSLIVYGRLPLMYLRHCPLRAAKGLKGLHRDCRRCDAQSECINQKTLIDRTGAAFPLRRIASGTGCVIQLRNSAKLMLLRKHSALPACEEWRLLLDESDAIEDIVHLHRLALDGEDCRMDGAWKTIEQMNTTTGHYFRGAE